MWVEALHAGLGWPTASAIISLSFLTSLMSAALGLGGGTVMLAVLANLLPASAIIPVHGVVQFGSNLGRAAVLLRHVDRSVLLPFALGSIIGVAVGGLVAVRLPPPVLQIGIGLFILWSVFMPASALMRRSSALMGMFSSFLTMFFGGTGPFVAAFVRTLELNRMRHVATHSTLMTLQHVLKSLAFGLLGFAFADWLPLVALMILAGFGGTLVGRIVLMRTDERRFRLMLNILLVVLALRLAGTGLMQLVGDI